MKILIIGGHGTIGKRVSGFYKNTHEVLIAGRSAGDIKVDITEKNAIRQMFEETGKFDAIICAAGEAKWAPFNELTEQDFMIGINSKLMGQVNLVRIGLNFLNPGGSITLTTGILADHPVPMTSSAAMVNGAIHSFVKALPQDIEPQFRINVVSSGLVEDAAEKYEAYFKGQPIISMSRVVQAYRDCIEGDFTGQIVRLYE
jgi:NAD(P)-dependent dehydrogenase (short-subunit alcohol dehydrogenase family)